MKTTTDFLVSADRYRFDTGECAPATGWAQFDTMQDAWYFGNWINPLTLQIVTYAEGDVIRKQAESEAEFITEVRAMLTAYEGSTIDHMCNPRIIFTLEKMGLWEAGGAADIELMNAPAFYQLPEGWTWQRVTEERAKREIENDRFYPVATVPGQCVAWGVPLAATEEGGAEA